MEPPRHNARFCTKRLLSVVVLALLVAAFLLYIGSTWQSPLKVYVTEKENLLVEPATPNDTRSPSDEGVNRLESSGPRNDSRDAAEQGPRNDTPDAAEQGPPNDARDAAEQGPPNDARDAAEQGPPNDARDAAEQGPPNDARDAAEQGPPNDARDAAEQGPRNDARDAAEQGPLNDARDAAEQGPPNDARDAAEQGPRNDTPDAAEQGPPNDARDAAEQGPPNDARDAAEQGPPNDARDAAEQGPPNDARDAAEQGPPNDARDATEQDPPNDARDAAEQGPRNDTRDAQAQAQFRSKHRLVEQTTVGLKGRDRHETNDVDRNLIGRPFGRRKGTEHKPGIFPMRGPGNDVPGHRLGDRMPRMDRMLEGGPIEPSGSCNLKYATARFLWARLHPEDPEVFVPTEDTLPGPGCDQRLPTALIIGSKKSGTGSLVSFLLANPLIRFPRGEVHYFCDRRYKYGSEFYREFMPVTTANQTTVEKTPIYFVDKEVPERVAKLNSSMRLILILKDPIERLISDYDHNKGGRRKTAPEKVSSLESLVFTESGEINANYEPISVSTYDIHVLRWLKHFPRDQLLVLDGNAFIDDPLPILQACERFLGVPPYITSDHLVLDKTKGYYCIIRSGDEPVCMPGKGKIHKTYQRSVTDKLREYFNPHVKRLENLIGEHLSWMDRYD